jgi:hypothetical protein
VEPFLSTSAFYHLRPQDLFSRETTFQHSSDQDEQKSDVNKRVYNRLRKFESWFNPQARNVVEDYKEGREITLEQSNDVLFYIEVVKEPINYNEAWNCSVKFHQRKWQEVINKELNEMKIRGVCN